MIKPDLVFYENCAKRANKQTKENKKSRISRKGVLTLYE